MNIILVLVGLLFLYLGGELLVRSASHLAEHLGLSRMLVGLTVVAFGTSSPELAASLSSVFQGVPDLATGNVIGSNIANIGLILGITAIFYPLKSNRKFIAQELPIMLFVMLAMFLVLFDNQIGRIDGAILFVLLIAYIVNSVISARREKVSSATAEILDQLNSVDKPEAEVTPESIAASHEHKDEFGHQHYQTDHHVDDASHLTQRSAQHLLKLILGTIAGIIILVLGAQSLIRGGVEIATAWGVSEKVIGLTLVAVGTSLPELASSIIAAVRKETDLILGGAIGSNIFNVLAILGVTALIKPINTTFVSVEYDLVVMFVFALTLLIFMIRGKSLNRIGAGILLLMYIAYSVYLFL